MPTLVRLALLAAALAVVSMTFGPEARKQKVK